MTWGTTQKETCESLMRLLLLLTGVMPPEPLVAMQAPARRKRQERAINVTLMMARRTAGQRQVFLRGAPLPALSTMNSVVTAVPEHEPPYQTVTM